MKIQLITNRNNYVSDIVSKITTLNTPHAFDSFDINIIDLSSKSIWVNDDVNTASCNCINDFLSLNKILELSKKSKNIIVLPQNVIFEYNKTYSTAKGRYYYKDRKQIKDILYYFSNNLLNKIVRVNLAGELLYENSETELNKNKYISAFVFNKVHTSYKILARSSGSNHATVISRENIIITTLDILDGSDKMYDFFVGTGLIVSKKEPIPEWLKDYEILDDSKQKAIIDQKKEQIEEAKKSIELAKEKLEKNQEYKSILFENGNSLVRHVFMILQELLEYDLSDFIDEKKEDFLIKLNDVTFIGEIKGVTSNVRSENVSQVDVHYYGYIDKLTDEGKKEKVKELLIMNPLRNTPLRDREPVHDIQIDLAKRNNCLIITTEVLLMIFEKFRKNEITCEKIKEKFTEEIGLLSLDVFER